MNALESVAIVIGALLVLTLLEFGGDWFYTHDNKYFVIGLLCYALIGIVWGVLVIKRKELNANLAVINAGWQILSIVAITILSRYILNEKLSAVTGIGLAVCCVGIAVVGIGAAM